MSLPTPPQIFIRHRILPFVLDLQGVKALLTETNPVLSVPVDSIPHLLAFEALVVINVLLLVQPVADVALDEFEVLDLERFAFFAIDLSAFGAFPETIGRFVAEAARLLYARKIFCGADLEGVGSLAVGRGEGFVAVEFFGKGLEAD